MNPSSNPEELINYLNNLNISEEINTFFSNNDKNQNGLVDADSFKNIFTELNQKIGIKEEMFGKKEWDWVLNLINKKSRDVLNKEEACKLYNQMVLIAKDYLYCLPPSNVKNIETNNIKKTNEIELMNKNNENGKDNNMFLLLKKHIFVCDSNNSKSINTLIDCDDESFIATIGAKGKIKINKSNFEVISYKKNFGYYVSCKLNSYIFSAKNCDEEGTLLYSNMNLNKLESVEMSEKHKSWISKIIQLSDNKFATASGDKTIKIWEIQSYKKVKCLKTLIGHTSDVISIIKIHNKDLLISCSYDNKIIIWDLNTYSAVREIKDVHCCFINGFKELPKERIAVSEENTITIINYMTGEIITKINTKIKSCCFEIINDILLVGCFDGSYLEINLNNYNQRIKNEKEINYITSMMKLPNSNILIVGLHNGVMKIYNY